MLNKTDDEKNYFMGNSNNLNSLQFNDACSKLSDCSREFGE